MKLQIKEFGYINKKNIDLITLSNKNGTSISISNYGCIITSLIMKDKHDCFDDIVLGYDRLEKYLIKHPFFGAVVGRFANRIENSEFFIKNKEYHLEYNENLTGQHIHGGIKGFDKYIWAYDIENKEKSIMVHFHRVSVDNEEGYPGNLLVSHTIGLDEENNIFLNYSAITDKETIINLTNHTYYNLLGHNKGSICNHHLKLFSDFYTPVRENMITTGEIRSVKNSGLDFTKSTLINENMNKLPNKEIDTNFILRGDIAHSDYLNAAELYEPISGRLMKIITTQPAVQVYNASKLSNQLWIGKGNHIYHSFDGICFETQHFPNSPKYSHFPSTLLKPNMVYTQKTILSFNIMN